MADEGSPSIEVGIFEYRGEIVELKVTPKSSDIGTQGDSDQTKKRHHKANGYRVHGRGYTASHPAGIGGHMKMMRLIPCGLLALLALFWLPVGSGAQGSGQSAGGCAMPDETVVARLYKRLASTEEKELDRLIDELTKLKKNCGAKTKLDNSNSIEQLLRTAEAQRERFGGAHRRVKLAGE